MATRQLLGVSTLPGMWTTFTRLSPEMSTPRMVPASKWYAMKASQYPRSGSSPTQHGHSTPHEHASSSVPWRSYTTEVASAASFVIAMAITPFSGPSMGRCWGLVSQSCCNPAATGAGITWPDGNEGGVRHEGAVPRLGRLRRARRRQGLLRGLRDRRADGTAPP